MAAIYIHVTDEIAKASQQAARKLGVSKTQFIRSAILHELENLESRQEQEAIAKCFTKMKTDPQYLQEAKEIEKGLNAPLSDDEEEEWWEKD